MITFKTAKKSQIREIVQLADKVFKHHNMDLEFPFLLSEENVDNIYIAVDNERIVGMFPTTIFNLIEDKAYKIVFVGAVCVDENFRGLNIIHNLMQLSFRDNPDSIYQISGFRSVYLANGAKEVTSLKSKLFTTGLIDNHVYELTLGDDNILDMYNLYSMESIRYEADFETYKKLLIASSICQDNIDYKIFGMKIDGKLLAYMIIDKSDNVYKNIECIGDIKYIEIIAAHLCMKLSTDFRLSTNKLLDDYEFTSFDNSYINQTKSNDIPFINPGIFKQ